MSEIVNRVANSKLITLDLEDYYPNGERIVFDIKPWLFQELILKEKDFRAHVKNHDWSRYKDSFVALTCSSDAIIPSWAYLLISTSLTQHARHIIIGDLQQLETSIFDTIISQIAIEQFKDKPVIIKGCSKKAIPETAYIRLIEKLQPVVRSLFFGEACSTVPLYKR